MSSPILKAFLEKKRRGWDKIYIAVDLHDTIIEGKYNLHNEGAAFFPNALNVLKNMTKNPSVYLILWTSSHPVAIHEQIIRMADHGIRFDAINSNSDVPSNELCDFGAKFYVSAILDDKAGFDAMIGWFEIETELRQLGEWIHEN